MHFLYAFLLSFTGTMSILLYILYKKSIKKTNHYKWKLKLKNIENDALEEHVDRWRELWRKSVREGHNAKKEIEKKLEDKQKEINKLQKKPGYKYRVYFEHSLGFNTHFAGEYDTREEAEKRRLEVEDSMYDAWIEVVEEGE